MLNQIESDALLFVNPQTIFWVFIYCLVFGYRVFKENDSTSACLIAILGLFIFAVPGFLDAVIVSFIFLLIGVLNPFGKNIPRTFYLFSIFTMGIVSLLFSSMMFIFSCLAGLSIALLLRLIFKPEQEEQKGIKL